MKTLLVKWLGYMVPEMAPLSLGEKIRSMLVVFVSILLMAYISSLFLHGAAQSFLVASMGATAVLLFALSHSPLSQPWPLLGGNFISALIAVCCAKYMPDVVWAAAISVSLSLLVMLLLRCLHPPGGALALLPVVGDHSVHELGFGFLLYPLGLNLLMLLLLGLLFNNLLPGRRYPAAFRPARDQVHKHDDAKQLERAGINQDDLHNALKQMNTYLDITEDDLNTVYKMAGMQAFRRKMGEIRCRDIMSRDLVTVDYGTELEEAWALLRYHKVKALPVIDPARRVIGIITLVDFLKRADLKTYATFQDKLIKFIRRTPGMNSSKPEVVGQIMAAPVYTANENAHIVELVPLLSERGLHHIPVVNAERRLVGMVTQSDLVAALYTGAVYKR